MAGVGQEQARQTVILQTILSLVGCWDWDGPIDGVWTDELTQSLMNFETAVGVEPTGSLDHKQVLTGGYGRHRSDTEASASDEHRL